MVQCMHEGALQVMGCQGVIPLANIAAHGTYRDPIYLDSPELMLMHMQVVLLTTLLKCCATATLGSKAYWQLCLPF